MQLPPYMCAKLLGTISWQWRKIRLYLMPFFAPFISTTTIVETALVESAAPPLDVEEEEEVPICEVVKTSKFSK